MKAQDVEKAKILLDALDIISNALRGSINSPEEDMITLNGINVFIAKKHAENVVMAIQADYKRQLRELDVEYDR